MSLFDPPVRSAGRVAWADLSIEYKWMFAYHAVMMVMFVTGVVPAAYEAAIAGGLILFFTGLSLNRRRQLRWQRQPLVAVDLLKSLGVVLLSGLFLFVASRGKSMANPHFLPWMLAGGGIALFGILDQMKLVAYSEADFLALGTPAAVSEPEAATPPEEPSWHRVVRAGYMIISLLIWLNGAAFFYMHNVAASDGSARPTAVQSVPFKEHGRVTYIEPGRASLIDAMQLAMMIGIPAVIFGGLFLHLGVGVRIFSNIYVMGKRVD